MAAVAQRLGQPFMPWQEQVALVGGEIDPDTGLPAYRSVIVTVPRQNGKTTLVLSWEVQRALGWGGPQKILYSAQSGTDARKKLLEDQFPILEPRKKKLGIRAFRRANGSEAVEFVNGSRIGLLASTEESGHGKTVDLGIKDELFADFDDRRDQALIPAMATRAAAQTLTTSTMGTDESLPLNREVDQGRAAVEAGLRSGIAYFEWSAGDDDDPDDPDTWWRCMPALGRTITLAVVEHARLKLLDGEFRRAFMNRRTKAENRVLPVEAWSAVCDPHAQPAGPLVFAIDVNPERSAAAIAVASGGDMPVGELLHHEPGTGWIVERAEALSKRWGKPKFVVDKRGPAASLIPELQAKRIRVHPVTAEEMTTACGQFYDGVMAALVPDGIKFRLRWHQKLDEAAAGAAKRSSGDAWIWARKVRTADVPDAVTIDICPLVAMTLAVWGTSLISKTRARAVDLNAVWAQMQSEQ